MKALRMTAALAALSLCGPAVAAPLSDALCLQQREAEELVVFALPVLVDVIDTTCGVGSQAANYRSESDAAWPGAKGVFGRVTDNSIMSLLDDKTLREMLNEAVAKAAGKAIKPRSCAAVGRMLTALSPLPARNVARVVVAVIELNEANLKLPLKLCPAQPRP